MRRNIIQNNGTWKNSIRKKGIEIMAAVAVTASCMTAHASEVGVVTAMSEKIYLENSEDSTILANMLEGTAVEVIMTVTDETGNTWYYVRTDTALEGYMPTGSVSIVQTQQLTDTQIQQEENEPEQGNVPDAVDEPQQEDENNIQEDNGEQPEQEADEVTAIHTLVTLDNVNIRQQPTVSSEQLGNILKDTEVEYSAAYTNEEGEIWYAVTYQGISGYVTADAVDTGNSPMEPQPWTADTETEEGNGTDTENDTDQNIENLIQEQETARTQETEQAVQTTVQSDETADIQTQETQTEEVTTRRGIRLPELFEITLCAGIVLCITAIVYIIQKIRLMLKNRR